MKKLSFALIYIITTVAFAQDTNFNTEDIVINKFIEGTLLKPQSNEQTSLAIIISDYGPINRDGNQNFQKNSVLKKLAVALAQNNIASFRYDKRTVKQIRRNNIDKKTTFDDFVTDAKSVIAHFKAKNTYSKIYIIGHGQGSLVGMLSANENVDGFISVAGSAKNIGDVIVSQVNATARQFMDETQKVVSTLKKGKTTKNFPPELASMFTLEMQPFMISWMAHEPVEVIKTLTIPIAIINGTRDLQVPVEDAKLLTDANQNAQLKTIDKMNHVLFTIEGDNLENSKSYNESFRKINQELVTYIVSFITKTN